MKHDFLVALVVTMLAFAGGNALAQGQPKEMQFAKNCEFASEMDANGDCLISEDEFFDYYEQSNSFETLDVNDDGKLDKDELGHGLYGYYDDNNDGYIDEGELEVTDDPDERGFWDY